MAAMASRSKTGANGDGAAAERLTIDQLAQRTGMTDRKSVV